MLQCYQYTYPRHGDISRSAWIIATEVLLQLTTFLVHYSDTIRQIINSVVIATSTRYETYCPSHNSICRFIDFTTLSGFKVTCCWYTLQDKFFTQVQLKERSRKLKFTKQHSKHSSRIPLSARLDSLNTQSYRTMTPIRCCL